MSLCDLGVSIFLLVIVFVLLIGVFISLIVMLSIPQEEEIEIDLSEKIGLEMYPYVFLNGSTFNAKIVVDDFAPDNELIYVQDYLEYLMKDYGMLPDTLIQYKHLNGLYDHNTIFIGTCNMEPHNKFVNIFMDCLSMEENIAMIRLVEKDETTIIQVVGRDFKDTKEALSVLMNHDKYNLSGREIEIRGETGNLTTRITG